MKKIKSKNVCPDIEYSFLPILTDSSMTERKIPLISAKSPNPGPVLWLTGCAHGDEVAGMVIIHEVFQKVCANKLLKGSVHALPLMNPTGFEMATRNITISNEDLNRSFPGNKSGSLGERIANTIFSTIMKTNPSVVLDIHNDWLKSIPYAIIDPKPANIIKEIYDKTKLFARATGLIVVEDTEDYENSLSCSLIKHNIPALTLELGESLIINEKNVEYGVKCISNILTQLEMIKPVNPLFIHQPAKNFTGKKLFFSQKPLSSCSGVIRFLTKPGDAVEKDQTIAGIYNSFGKLEETLISPHNGIVLGHSDHAVTFPGSPVMAFGVSAK